jgi:hypothetical protein
MFSSDDQLDPEQMLLSREQLLHRNSFQMIEHTIL